MLCPPLYSTLLALINQKLKKWLNSTKNGLNGFQQQEFLIFEKYQMNL